MVKMYSLLVLQTLVALHRKLQLTLCVVSDALLGTGVSRAPISSSTSCHLPAGTGLPLFLASFTQHKKEVILKVSIPAGR